MEYAPGAESRTPLPLQRGEYGGLFHPAAREAALVGCYLGSARLYDSAEGYGGCREGGERDQSYQADVPELSDEIG